MVLLAVTAYGSQHVNKMPDGINWSKWGVAVGKVNCHELDPTAQDGDFEYCSTADGGPGCVAGSDPCICAPAGQTDATDVFAYRDHGRWRCDGGGGQCTECTDFASCGFCPTNCCTQQIGDPCTTSAECCVGFCVDGFCATGGGCSPTACTATRDCCEGFCLGGSCVSEAPTTTSTSTSTSTSTTGATTSSTTTSTSTTVTTTTNALLAASIQPELPGTYFSAGNPSPAMQCVVVKLVAGISGATTLAGAFQGGGNCTVAIYDDDDAGALKGSITGTCPTLGVLSDTTAAFTLNGGAAYRFCVCSDVATTNYLESYNDGPPLLMDAFSVSIGHSTNTCSSPGAVPPVSTGALLSDAGSSTVHHMPFISVE